MAFERFTDRARKVMGLAKSEAQRLGHEYIGTEHLLLGLVQEGGGVGARALRAMNIDLKLVRAGIETIVQVRPTTVTHGILPFTPQAKKVLELAVEEASNLGHRYFGTEHLLLGLIKEDQGIATRVLHDLGVGLDRAREVVLDLLETRAPDATRPAAPAAPSDAEQRERQLVQLRQEFEDLECRIAVLRRLIARLENESRPADDPPPPSRPEA